MNYKKSYLTLTAGIIGGAIFAFIGVGVGTKSVLFGNIIGSMGIVSMLASIGQTFLYYKCPYCKKPLNIRQKKPNHCPSCGHRLEL